MTIKCPNCGHHWIPEPTPDEAAEILQRAENWKWRKRALWGLLFCFLIGTCRHTPAPGSRRHSPDGDERPKAVVDQRTDGAARSP